MSLRVQVFETVRQYSFPGEGGKTVEGAKQEAYLHVPGARFPVKMDVSLQKGVPPLRVGDYVTGPGCFAVREGKCVITLKSGDLLPVDGSKAQLAGAR